VQKVDQDQRKFLPMKKNFSGLKRTQFEERGPVRTVAFWPHPLGFLKPSGAVRCIFFRKEGESME
jgi:hypothetical protein